MNTLYINTLDQYFFLVFDWATENVITLGWTNQYIGQLMASYITGEYCVSFVRQTDWN